MSSGSSGTRVTCPALSFSISFLTSFMTLPGAHFRKGGAEGVPRRDSGCGAGGWSRLGRGQEKKTLPLTPAARDRAFCHAFLCLRAPIHAARQIPPTLNTHDPVLSVTGPAQVADAAIAHAQPASRRTSVVPTREAGPGVCARTHAQ